MMQRASQLPDFLVIGTAKAGTTSLYQYLKSHPEVYLSPIKEPRYFAHPEVRPAFVGPLRNLPRVWKIEDYRRLFEARTTELVAGEMSPQYLYHECSPGAICKLIPKAKLIAILRDPADRAFSHFCHNRRDGIESLADFAAALAVEDERIAQNWWPAFHYRHRGYYAQQLKRYLRLFPREQLLILVYDDMVADCPEVLKRICAFLGVDESHSFDTTVRYNVSWGMPHGRLIHSGLKSALPAKRLIRAMLPARMRENLSRMASTVLMRRKPGLDPSLREQLVSQFKPDILELQKIIGRDLSPWLRC
jgi:hypothetical protein